MDIPALHTLTNGIIIGICLSISFGLVCFKQMAHAINPKYRRACHFFIAASLIIAAGHLAELLVDGFGVYRSLDLFSILVLVLASSQALMFTFMLILLFDSRYVTFANVMKHAAPSLVFILLYVVSCCIEADVCVYSLQNGVRVSFTISRWQCGPCSVSPIPYNCSFTSASFSVKNTATSRI